MSTSIKVCLIQGEPAAILPTRGSSGAAGYDLHAYLPTGKFRVNRGTREDSDNDATVMDVIPPGWRALIPTGVSIAIPAGLYGRIAPRSGLAWKSGLDVLAGVIDPDYRGDVGMVVVNHGNVPIRISHGDRCAQLIFERCDTPDLQVVATIPAQSDDERGTAGFGSTGVSIS